MAKLSLALIAVLVTVYCLVATEANAENLRRALQPKEMIIGWAGEGFLGIYHLGVLSKLHDLGWVRRDTPMAGSSSGAILTGTFCAGTGIEVMKQSTFTQVEYCKNVPAPYCGGNLDAFNRAGLEASLPNGIGNIKKCRSTAFIHLTEVNQTVPAPACFQTLTTFLAITGQVSVATYEDRAQLIDAMASSSFIPGISAPQCSTTYSLTPTKEITVVDGAFSSVAPCPPTHPNCVKVSGKPYGIPNGQTFAQIYPGIRKDDEGNPILPGTLTMADYQSGTLAFNFPMLSIQKEAMFEAGRLDAQAYVNSLPA